MKDWKCTEARKWSHIHAHMYQGNVGEHLFCGGTADDKNHSDKYGAQTVSQALSHPDVALLRCPLAVEVGAMRGAAGRHPALVALSARFQHEDLRGWQALQRTVVRPPA